MLPYRYSSFRHALGLIRQEEGIKGLFRGFTPFFIATSCHILLVPFFAEMLIIKTPIMGFN